MDPDTTLNEIRELCEDPDRDYFEIMVEKFQALDAWLSSGGFLPRSWDLAIGRINPKAIEGNHEEIWCERCAKGNHYFFDQNGRPVENCNCCGKEKS